eukprot:5895818-Ditylum_brightwellii.AAC.2
MHSKDGESEISKAKERKKRIANVEICSFAEVVNLLFLKLLTVDPLAVIRRTFLMACEVNGSLHCAEVMHCGESMDGETEQYLVHLGKERGKRL